MCQSDSIDEKGVVLIQSDGCSSKGLESNHQLSLALIKLEEQWGPKINLLFHGVITGHDST